jgi:hypothetical protein
VPESTKDHGKSWYAELFHMEISDNNHKRLGITSKLTFLISIVLTIPIMALAITSIITFAYFFRDFSDKADSWNLFANFFGFLGQFFIGIATIALAVYASLVISRKIEAEKRRDERNRELIRLSEKMVDHDFYVKVVYPAWEVALKWFGLEGARGDEYRTLVICGETRLPKIYRSSEGAGALFENHVRNHPHYLPYDRSHRRKDPPVMNELSESLAFATWVRFWQHIAFLIKEEVINDADATSLFREWYMWWAPFMVEFIAVSEAVIRRTHPRANEAKDAKDAKEAVEAYLDQLAIRKIAFLHGTMGISSHLGHASQAEFETHIEALTDRLMKHIGPAITGTANPAAF